VSNKSPLISIITVCFNAAQFLEQTMQSVLSQTYPHIEYIVIDGGSYDGTVEIIRKYESRLAYWHSKPDRGLGHALNLGMTRARGEWILYLHADDFLLDASVVENIAPYLLNHTNTDVVYGNCIRMTREPGSQPAPFCHILGGPWNWQVYRCRSTLPHQAAFTNRRYFDRVGQFNEALARAVDYELYLRGGASLMAVHVPLAVSGMRVGGLSGNTVHTLREALNAQLLNQALPPWIARVNFFAGIGRNLGGSLLHKMLDPFFSRISLPGRNRTGSYNIQREDDRK
jgi:glycosyltransferase involved in cell wall biosynthesis